MNLDVRRTTPFTQDEYAEVQLFAAQGTPEHEALVRVSPTPLRDGSEGSALRSLVLLGIEYVHGRQAEIADLATGYQELAAERSAGKLPSPLRANMARRARAAATPSE